MSLKDRIRVLKAYKKTGTYDKVALLFKCSAHQIRNIVQAEKKTILREYVNSEEYTAAKRARLEKTVKSEVAIVLEKILCEWFQRAQRHIEAGPITNEMLLQKALEAKKILCLNNFNIDLDWLLKFRQKYDITDLDMNMLRIDNDNRAPPVLDLNEIAAQVEHQNPATETLAEQSRAESLSDLDESDFELDDLNETSSQQTQLFEQICSCSNDDSRTSDKTEVIELDVPPIVNDDQARRHLKPLEDYVLMKENFRAIGIIAQLEKIFKMANEN